MIITNVYTCKQDFKVAASQGGVDVNYLLNSETCLPLKIYCILKYGRNF